EFVIGGGTRNRATGGHGGRQRNVVIVERYVVEDVLVPSANEHHWIVGRRNIELLRERQSLLRELRLVPVAVADENLAGRGGRHRFGDDGIDVSQRACAGEIHAAPA